MIHYPLYENNETVKVYDEFLKWMKTNPDNNTGRGYWQQFLKNRSEDGSIYQLSFHQAWLIRDQFQNQQKEQTANLIDFTHQDLQGSNYFTLAQDTTNNQVADEPSGNTIWAYNNGVDLYDWYEQNEHATEHSKRLSPAELNYLILSDRNPNHSESTNEEDRSTTSSNRPVTNLDYYALSDIKAKDALY
ncbi:uncharacterized protein L201_007479 [Kwoniella dendrophila CBS 6074]|uniref:DUF4214 domain-containing protein n=1 Tax=Kwoniella dendrophila CBS 6074 TaxID=1295534 RepID=A0AAX4K6T0_9TREE